MQESFLTYARYRWLLIGMLLMIGSIVAYSIHSPFEGANGGTWLGYTLGSIGAILIFWLTWFGVRKRSYSASGNLRGWLSAHVYLGASLIIIATLHTGFQFGINIHTLAYVLMMLVILSGFFGIFCYLRYPNLITRNRSNTSREAMLEEIDALDQEALALADKLGPKIHNMVIKSVESTKIGGSAWAQLTARDNAQQVLDSTRDMLDEMTNQPETGEMPTMFAMVDFLAGAGGEDAEKLRSLMDVLQRKKMLTSKISRDIQYQALMEIWLYFHVPLTMALIAALIAHIVSVFFYW